MILLHKSVKIVWLNVLNVKMGMSVKKVQNVVMKLETLTIFVNVFQDITHWVV